jgi:hypothetical protein
MITEQDQEIKENAVKALESYLTFIEKHGDEILTELLRCAESYKKPGKTKPIYYTPK